MHLDRVARLHALVGPGCRREFSFAEVRRPVAGIASVIGAADEHAETRAFVFGVGMRVNVAEVHFAGCWRQRERLRVQA